MAVSGPPLLGSYLGVAEVSTTSGSGAFALLGAIANSLPFGAKVPDGTTITIKVDGGAQIEFLVAIFSYPSTITPVSVISSTNSDQKIEWPATGQRIISLEQDIPNLPLGSGDVPCPFPDDGVCAQALIKTGPDCYDNEWQYRPYPIAVWIDGPPSISQKVRLAVTEPLMFMEDFAGSWAYCGEDKTPTNPVFSIAVNRVRPPLALGTLEFGEGYSQAVWSSTDHDKQYLIPGDMIEFAFPADIDTIEDISITARGLIVCAIMAIQFCGGAFPGEGVAGAESSSILQFALPAAPVSADTIFMAGWFGYFNTDQGHNLVLVFDNSADHFVIVTLGDGTTIPVGSFAFVMSFFDSSSNEVLSGFVEIPVDLTEGWHSFAISIRASTQTLQILIDRVLYPVGANLIWFSSSEIKGAGAGLGGRWQLAGALTSGGTNATDTPPAFTVSSNGLIFAITPLAPDASFYKFLMALGDSFVDLTDASTVSRLFGAGADQELTDWGERGELITGSVPAAYFIGDVSTFRFNLGPSGSIDTGNWIDGGPGELGVRVQNFLPLPP